ncbi:MAG: 3-deoxy-8-phosphooctulonate synthase [Deltaproteobacteria bacterium]|nr:3-deoxy-8-phosphooctulonate synthase [Deltaproteobacteria bacterium]
MTIGNLRLAFPRKNLFFICGPCVLEDKALALDIAARIKEAAASLGADVVFKASFDKANRTSAKSFRGPGMDKGLSILAEVKEATGLSVTSDIHLPEQAGPAAEVLDMIQIPAFLCRQTDLLVAAGETGLAVNVKKGQFMAPWDMVHAAEKIASTGNRQILFTERGSFFGYNNLVVDMRSIAILRDLGHPVVFDATHSVQLPGGGSGCSSGDREMAPVLARAAVAAGCDGVFFEVHPQPDRAECDGPNSLVLADLPGVLENLAAVRAAVAGQLKVPATRFN